MKKTLRLYFLHPTNWLLIGFLIASLLINLHTGLLFKHYLVLLLPIILMPFYEWFAHKYLLHYKHPKSEWLKRYMIRLHYGHHIEPKNVQLLFAPVSAIIISHLQMYLLCALLTQSFAIAVVGLTSTTLCYLYYEWTHLGHHVHEYQHFTAYGRKMKKAHMMHHYTNDNYWWGITSNIADVFFGTYKSIDEVDKTQDLINHTSGARHGG